MTIVDTCVWIDHFRRPDQVLADLLKHKKVLLHPFVFGELAVGSMPSRPATLGSLQLLRPALVATEEGVIEVVESHRLWGRGLGWVDAHLLASALMEGCKLLTYDKQLGDAAKKLGVAFPLQ